MLKTRKFEQHLTQYAGGIDQIRDKRMKFVLNIFLCSNLLQKNKNYMLNQLKILFHNKLQQKSLFGLM